MLSLVLASMKIAFASAKAVNHLLDKVSLLLLVTRDLLLKLFPQ